MGSFDFRGAQSDPQRIYFDLACWYETCVPPAAPFSPEPPVVRTIEVARPDRNVMPACGEHPLAWLDAALHAIAVLHGQVAADRLARAVRNAGMATIEGYGLAWRLTSIADGVARFEVQPVVAALTTLGFGVVRNDADSMALWRLVARRREDLGLDGPDAVGIRLAPPSRPLAAFSLQCTGAAKPTELVRLRRIAHRTVDRLLRHHAKALARMPHYLGANGRGVVAGTRTQPAAARSDAGRAGGAADWEQMFEHWLQWQAEHPHRRPPQDSALARWLDQQLAAALGGSLTRRQLEMLDESGMPLTAPAR